MLAIVGIRGIPRARRDLTSRSASQIVTWPIQRAVGRVELLDARSRGRRRELAQANSKAEDTEACQLILGLSQTPTPGEPGGAC